MSPERRGVNPTEKSALLNILPKPFGSYPSKLQLYIKVAAQQPVKPDQQIALVVYSVYFNGIPHTNTSTLDRIAEIMGMPEEDIKKCILDIENRLIEEWQKFEEDHLSVKRKRSSSSEVLELRQAIIDLRKQGCTTPEIAEALGVTVGIIRSNTMRLIKDNVIPPKGKGGRPKGSAPITL